MSAAPVRRPGARGRRPALALAALLALALGARPARAQLFSLFPERSPRDAQAALDGLAPWQPRLLLGSWRPHGLPATVHELELAAAPGGFRLALAASRQDWGPVGAWRLGARALRPLGSGLVLGLAAGSEQLDAGRAAGELSLLAALGRRPVLSLSARLAGAPGPGLAPRSAGTQLGLSLAEGPWTLRLWRRPGGPLGAEDGLSLERRQGPLEIALLANWPGWQGLALRWGGERWGLAVEERFHAELGASHGLRFLVR
ncbi:hypothetical protein FJ251_01930 [bacterium]|nr:hypothetical protein [bacterium]